LVAYAVNGLFVGLGPLFIFPQNLPIHGLPQCPAYLVLDLVGGLVATAVPMVLYTIRDAFHRLPLPRHSKPAIGGFCVGLLGMALPQVPAGGYGWMQLAIDGRLPRCSSLRWWSAKQSPSGSLSDGSSGGVFAPTLFVGATLGGFMAAIFHHPPRDSWPWAWPLC
jgi:CIC family chloride channel protein